MGTVPLEPATWLPCPQTSVLSQCFPVTLSSVSASALASPCWGSRLHLSPHEGQDRVFRQTRQLETCGQLGISAAVMKVPGWPRLCPMKLARIIWT